MWGASTEQREQDAAVHPLATQPGQLPPSALPEHMAPVALRKASGGCLLLSVSGKLQDEELSWAQPAAQQGRVSPIERGLLPPPRFGAALTRAAWTCSPAPVRASITSLPSRSTQTRPQQHGTEHSPTGDATVHPQ